MRCSSSVNTSGRPALTCKRANLPRTGLLRSGRSASLHLLVVPARVNLHAVRWRTVAAVSYSGFSTDLFSAKVALAVMARERRFSVDALTAAGKELGSAVRKRAHLSTFKEGGETSSGFANRLTLPASSRAPPEERRPLRFYVGSLFGQRMPCHALYENIATMARM